MPAPVTPDASLRWDVLVYAGCAALAGGIGAVSDKPAYLAWAEVATVGYAGAAVLAMSQSPLARRGMTWAGRTGARVGLAGLVWVGTALVPLLLLVTARAAGRTGGVAQVEVRVIERAAQRLIDSGTPYLGRDQLAALPMADQIQGYVPYQPGMALFGLPRALDPASGWWSDPRIWFAAVTVTALVATAVVLGPAGAGRRVRAWQAVAVLPTVTLPVAVSGDDPPVLGLCVLALALTARGRLGAAGAAVGLASAVKLTAWPVLVVLAVHAATRGRAALTRYLVTALGIPAVVHLPAVVVDPAAVLENTVRFPLGLGLVESLAQGMLPGHLIATHLPGGRTVAIVLLVATGAAMTVWMCRRPPRTAGAAAAMIGIGLAAAILLMPATRPGYLLYPVGSLAFAYALRRDRLPAGRPCGGIEPLPVAAVEDGMVRIGRPAERG